MFPQYAPLRLPHMSLQITNTYVSIGFRQIAFGPFANKTQLLFQRSGRICRERVERDHGRAPDETLKIELLNFRFACVGSTVRNSLLIYFNAKIPTQSYTVLRSHCMRSERIDIDNIEIEQNRPFDRIGIGVEWRRLFSFIIICVWFLLLLFFLHLRCISVVGRAAPRARACLREAGGCQ